MACKSRETNLFTSIALRLWEYRNSWLFLLLPRSANIYLVCLRYASNPNKLDCLHMRGMLLIAYLLDRELNFAISFHWNIQKARSWQWHRAWKQNIVWNCVSCFQTGVATPRIGPSSINRWGIVMPFAALFLGNALESCGGRSCLACEQWQLSWRLSSH